MVHWQADKTSGDLGGGAGGGGAGCGKAAGCLGCRGQADLRGNRLRVDDAIATLGETPSLTQESVRKCARDQQVSCIVPSLAPPPQAVPQHSKEGCPARVNTSGSTPLQLNRCTETKK